MKKDILFLCQFFYPEYNSSATLPFDTAKYLAEHGFSVGALCGYPKEYNNDGNVPMKEIKDGVDIQRIKYIQLKRGSKIGRLINYFSFTFKAMLHIGKLKNYKSVIVYSNPPILPLVAVMANVLFKTKIVFVSYDVYPEVAYASKTLNPGSLISKVMNKLNHQLFKRVTKVISLTDEMKDFLLENRKELTEDKVVTIPNWAHEKLIVPSKEAYDRFGYNENQFIVSYFGNMGTCQDMETLMEAVEKLRNDENIKFLFVGHGNKVDSIREKIRKDQLKNIQLLDFLTGKDFEQAVAISSCCVVSLEKGLKGTCAPSKYYSYLQGGKPILGIVEEGSYLEAEIKKEKLGYVTHNQNSDLLVKHIKHMSENKSECLEIGKRVTQVYMNNYDIEICLNKYVDEFYKAVERNV